VRIPRSIFNRFTVETGIITLPASLGRDKIVDSAILELEAANFNERHPVSVEISVADAQEPGRFRSIASFDLAIRETRALRVVQTGAADGLVRATQSESINIRFDARSPGAEIGEIEFRFTIHVLAHKRTPGTGAGTLLFY
jgi:hypothetical protein